MARVQVGEALFVDLCQVDEYCLISAAKESPMTRRVSETTMDVSWIPHGVLLRMRDTSGTSARLSPILSA